ncbi:hypothetical protein [Mesorhizobium onobrychidis]|uniref:hypothetical protein n=1 Tax=Mesorhizobium onobrychidis TaxID=2775404 RepID=UPI0021583CF6|nr:hypothetical protein [Mesorhizobium onobrychidis]
MYERQIAVEDDDSTVRHLHPDFYYPQTDTVHEHFALNADGTSPFADYVQHAESKRQAYRRKEIDFFETTLAQASSETLLSTLELELARRAVHFQRKSYAEITKAGHAFLAALSTCNACPKPDSGGQNVRFRTNIGKNVRFITTGHVGHCRGFSKHIHALTAR